VGKDGGGEEVKEERGREERRKEMKKIVKNLKMGREKKVEQGRVSKLIFGQRGSLGNNKLKNKNKKMKVKNKKILSKKISSMRVLDSFL
jgi:hypothetical protein